MKGGAALMKNNSNKGRRTPGPADGMIEHTQPSTHGPGPTTDDARLRQRAIGVKLRQMFDDVVNEPVPDEFLEILRRADAGGRKED